MFGNLLQVIITSSPYEILKFFWIDDFFEMLKERMKDIDSNKTFPPNNVGL